MSAEIMPSTAHGPEAEQRPEAVEATAMGPVSEQRPERVQLRRVKGWRMPPNTMSVARPGRWGNPYYASKWRPVSLCLALFRNTMNGVWNPSTSERAPPAWQGYDCHRGFMRRIGYHPAEAAVAELRGKNLACWCALTDAHGNYVPCHADVLLSLANDIPLEEVISENIRRAKGEAVR